MPRRANIRPEEAGRDRILEAGRAVFGERGLDATSIAEIGERAGIAKSLLYHHFGSKAGLYEANLEDDGAQLVAAVAAAVPPPEDDDSPRLRPGVDALLRFFHDHPDIWRLAVRDSPSDPQLREVHARVDASVSDALRGVLTTPEKRLAKPDLVDLVALAVRTYSSWWYDHSEVPREEVLEAILDVATAGATRIMTRTLPHPAA
jgi:AcrR family transcriptional regulator